MFRIPSPVLYLCVGSDPNFEQNEFDDEYSSVLMSDGATANPLPSGKLTETRPNGTPPPRLFHLVAALWVCAVIFYASYSPSNYAALMQEDRPVEWGTVWLFAAAGAFHLRRAIRRRLVFDGLVALFCLFVAGEEFSWGQRLLGFSSPDYFLANNFQQEVNLHNLPGAVVKPKWVLIFALVGYGVLLPLVSGLAPARRLLDKLGSTPPPLLLAPWYALAVALLLWYPFTLTGEWVEFLAGALFLASIRLFPGTLWMMLSLSLIFGVSFTKFTDILERGRDSERVACARLEIEALVNDLLESNAANAKLKKSRSVHKRMWSASNDEYIVRDRFREFDLVRCENSGSQGEASRRAYMVDPWGMSYWVYTERVDEGKLRVAVYSFGPNRRRDAAADSHGGDDISANGFMDLK